MAPSPAAGRQSSGAPKTPTKLGRKPQSTPQKLGQSAKSATPKSSSKPDTDDAQKKAGGVAGKAEEATKDAGDEAQSKVEMKDDEDENEDEEPLSKVSKAGQEGKENLEEAAPEPVNDDDDDDDAVEGATEQAEGAADDAEDEAEDVADDATQKAGQTGESADETADETADDATEDQEDQGEDDGEKDQQEGGLLKGAQGLADKAGSLAGNAPKDASKAAEDTKDGVEDAAEDAEDTADDAGEEGQKVAGETTDEAGEQTEAGDDDAEDAVDGVKEEAEDAASDAEDQAEDATSDVEGQAEEATSDVEGQAEEAASDVEGQTKDVADDTKDQAEDAASDAEGAVDGAEGETDEAAEGAKDAAEDAEGETDEATKSAQPPADLPLDLSVLKGQEVQADGTVHDSEGNPIGKLAEGDAEDLEGYPIGDNGEILDDDGDLVGRVELMPDEVKRQIQEKKDEGEELPEGAEEYLDQLDEGEEGEDEDQDEDEEAEEDTGLPALSILEGLTCQVDGIIYDSEGNTVGKVTDGDPAELVNATINDQGEFIDEDGNVVGHADIHEDAAELVDQGVYEAASAAQDAQEDAEDAAEDAEGAADDATGAVGDAEDAAEDAQDAAEDAQDAAEDAQEQAEGIEDELPGIEALEGKELDEAGNVVDDKGEILAKIDDEELREKIESGEIDPATLEINEEGQVVDQEGNVLGGMELAEGAAEKLGKLAPTYDIRILDGKKVNKKGKVLDDDGEEIGQLTEGDPKQCTGKKINEKGEVVDKEGNPIGKVGITEGEAAETATKDLLTELGELPEEEEEQEEEQAAPGLDVLDGLKVNKKGQILDEDGEPIGELVEGDVTQCAGKKVNDKGEVLDKDGNVVGRVQTIGPQAEEEPEEEQPEEEQPEEEESAPGLDVLTGYKINKSGKIVNEDGEQIGELTEGDVTQCAGKTPNAKGEVLDSDGNVIGRVATTGPLAEEQEETPGLDVLEGYKINKSGQIINEDGELIGELVEGDVTQCAGKKVNDKGEVLDKDGNVIGRVQTSSPEEEQEEEEEGDGLPPLSVLEGLTCNKAGKLVDSNGTIVGELVEGDAKKLSKSGLTADAEGQFWDNKGHVIGRAQTVAVEDAEEESPFAGLEGLKVIEDGYVADENGNVVGVVTEGDPKKLIGRSVDEDGDIIDKKGSVVGHAERYEEEEVEEAQPDDLSFLKGKTLNKAGVIIGDEGVPVARLVEGNAKELAGRKVDGEGQIWNDSGEVIGRVELIPADQREAKPEGPFAGLEDLRVVEDGKVADEDGHIHGEIVEGNAKRLIGLAVDEDGDIVDKYGNVKGHAEPLPDEEEPEPVDNSILEGKMLNKQGYVVNEEGIPFGRLVEGNVKELAGRRCDENGFLYGDTGKVVGRCEVIPDNERVARPEGPFSGLEGLRVVKDGKVEDQDGNVVGEIVEGNPKRLVGLAVDEDGDILDRSGNVKGHAEPVEEEDPEAEDLSILAGSTINKAGNAVDGNGRIVGRLVEGDPSTMIDKKVDGQGQVWDNAGNVVGRCEVVHGQDTKADGPFAGFEGLQINKDETITTPAGDIIGRVIEGDIKKLLGHQVDEDGDINDKNGNTIGRAERWEPEEKDRRVNPMSGMRVNKEGEVRDENGDLVGRLTDGDLGHCVSQEIDDNGNVIDQDGNKIGEVTLLENINEEEYVGPTEEELAEAAKREEEREIAEKMNGICTQTLERMQPICKQIKEHMEKADRTPRDELDEEQLVNDVKPLIEEGGRVLQECNGSLRGLDPDGKIAAQAKGRAGTGEATAEEHKLAENLKELTTTVVTTIDDAKKKLNDMPHAKKKLNPLWGLMTQPLFQILAAVGLLLAGVLGLVGQLLNGLGLGGLVNGLLGGLGINKLLSAVGLKDDDSKKKKGGKGGSAMSNIPIVGGLLGGK